MKTKQVIKELLKLGFQGYKNTYPKLNYYNKMYQFIVNNKKHINVYYYELSSVYNNGKSCDLELEIYRETKNKTIKESRYGYKDFEYLLEDVKKLLRR